MIHSSRDVYRNKLYRFFDEAVTLFQNENKGLLPSRQQLLETALDLKKKRRIRTLKISAKEVAHYYLQGGPNEFVQYSTPKRVRPKYFQTISVIKLGMWHIDYADFHRAWSEENDGKTGFILAVENFTNKLFVDPCRGTHTAVWLSAIKKLLKKYPNISSFYSDPDPVATSPKFRKLIHDKYNIRWLFLRKNNKSFLAERYIGLVKLQISMSLASSFKKDGISRRWIDLVQPLVDRYNQLTIPHTTFRRCDVNQSNFDKFLQQFTGLKQPDMQFYLSHAGPFKNQHWNRLFFKFDLGQKVMINPDANYHLIKGKRFNWKKSIKGFYDTKIFTISGRQLRRTDMKKNTLVPVYALAEFDKLFALQYPPRNEAEQKKLDWKLQQRNQALAKRFNFYENELIAVPARPQHE